MTKAMNEASREYSITHLCVANNLKEVFIYWVKQLCDIVQLLNILSDLFPKELFRPSAQDFVK